MMYAKPMQLSDGRTVFYHQLNEVKILMQDKVLVGYVKSWELLPTPDVQRGDTKMEYSLQFEEFPQDCYKALEDYIFSLPEWQGAIKVDFNGNPI